MARVGYLPPGKAKAHGREQPGVGARRVAVLSAIVALSAFDRLLIAPLLTSVSKGLAVSVGLVSLVATVHFLSYGFVQIGHGWVSDRIGRVSSLRLALLGVAVGNAVAAIAPSVGIRSPPEPWLEPPPEDWFRGPW